MPSSSSTTTKKRASSRATAPAPAAKAPASSSSKGATQEEVVNAAVRGGTGLMAVMMLQRGMNFVLNQLLLRYVDPAIFGIASVPLDLLLNTALFLSREGFRLALGRKTLVGIASDRTEFRQFVNLSWMPVVLGPLISLLSLSLLPSAAGGEGKADNGDDQQQQQMLRMTGILFCVAASLESLSEPAYLICQGGLITWLRAASEGLATLARSALTFALLAWVLPSKQALLAFGIAQIGYSLVLLVVYWGYLVYLVITGGSNSKKKSSADSSSSASSSPLHLHSLHHLLPGRPAPGLAWVESEQLTLAGALTGQSFFKHLLTQGDKIVLSLGSSHYSQGLYALAQNYGSLAARLFFQPLEEAGRLMFSRLAAAVVIEQEEEEEGEGEGGQEKEPFITISTAAEAATASKRKTRKTDAEPEGPQQAAETTTTLKVHASSKTTLGLMLGALVKMVVLVGLIFACFGFNYTRVLLHLLLPGKKWSGSGTDEASHVLSWYCIYVLFLAVNGMTEAFVYAVALQKEVARLSLATAVSFMTFAALTLPLMERYGTIGLVLANVCGMVVRICFSLSFIRAYFSRAGEPLPEMFPSPVVLASFVGAFAGTLASDSGVESMDDWLGVGVHVLFGCGALGCVLGTVWFVEGEFLGDLKGIRRLARGGGGGGGEKAKEA